MFAQRFPESLSLRQIWKFRNNIRYRRLVKKKTGDGFAQAGRRNVFLVVQRSRPFKGGKCITHAWRIHRHPASRKHFSDAHSIGSVITLSAYSTAYTPTHRVQRLTNETPAAADACTLINSACNDDIFANLNLAVRPE